MALTRPDRWQQIRTVVGVGVILIVLVTGIAKTAWTVRSAPEVSMQTIPGTDRPVTSSPTRGSRFFYASVTAAVVGGFVLRMAYRTELYVWLGDQFDDPRTFFWVLFLAPWTLLALIATEAVVMPLGVRWTIRAIYLPLLAALLLTVPTRSTSFSSGLSELPFAYRDAAELAANVGWLSAIIVGLATAALVSAVLGRLAPQSPQEPHPSERGTGAADVAESSADEVAEEVAEEVAPSPIQRFGAWAIVPALLAVGGIVGAIAAPNAPQLEDLVHLMRLSAEEDQVFAGEENVRALVTNPSDASCDEVAPEIDGCRNALAFSFGPDEDSLVDAWLVEFDNPEAAEDAKDGLAEVAGNDHRAAAIERAVLVIPADTELDAVRAVGRVLVLWQVGGY